MIRRRLRSLTSKTCWEIRTNTVWGLIRRKANLFEPGDRMFYVRLGDGSGNLVRFEIGTGKHLFYATWNVWPRARRFQWSAAYPSITAEEKEPTNG